MEQSCQGRGDAVERVRRLHGVGVGLSVDQQHYILWNRDRAGQRYRVASHCGRQRDRSWRDGVPAPHEARGVALGFMGEHADVRTLLCEVCLQHVRHRPAGVYLHWRAADAGSCCAIRIDNASGEAGQGVEDIGNVSHITPATAWR